MLFPAELAAASAPDLPASAARLEIDTPDGERLVGVHLPPTSEPTGNAFVLLGFGGNAWNADALAIYLHDLVPHAHVVAFHYRGYRPSTGAPSAAALLADAPLVHDRVAEAVPPARIVAVGISIGSGVAARLAAERPIAGLILVTPFDSLEALAREHYPWAPVGLLLRHRMSPADALRGLATPTAIIGAGRDQVVPPQRTEALRKAIGNLVLDRTIAEAGHNDLFDHPGFRAAIAEAVGLMTSAE